MRLSIEIEAKNQAQKAFQELSKQIKSLSKDIGLLQKGHQNLHKDYNRLNAANKRSVDLYKKYGSALEKVRTGQIRTGIAIRNTIKSINDKYVDGDLVLIKNYGTGGSAETETSIQTFQINASYASYTASFVFHV